MENTVDSQQDDGQEQRTDASRDRIDLSQLHRMRTGRSGTSGSDRDASAGGESAAAPEEQKVPAEKPVRVGEESTLDRLRKQQDSAGGTGIRNLSQEEAVGADEPIIEEVGEPKAKPRAPKQQAPKPSKPATAPADDGSGLFECNICLDAAKEPVVTQCGHLYCWKCIYQWLGQPRETLVCPVCKSGISQDKLIPIFTKENNDDPRKNKEEAKQDIPNRPGGQRSEPQRNENYHRGAGFGMGPGGNSLFGNSQGGFVMGLGLFPALFTLNFTWDDIFGPTRAGPDNQQNGSNSGNPEESQESNLQKFLMMFVLFMFLSFVLFGGDVFLVF